MKPRKNGRCFSRFIEGFVDYCKRPVKNVIAICPSPSRISRLKQLERAILSKFFLPRPGKNVYAIGRDFCHFLSFFNEGPLALLLRFDIWGWDFFEKAFLRDGISGKSED